MAIAPEPAGTDTPGAGCRDPRRNAGGPVSAGRISRHRRAQAAARRRALARRWRRLTMRLSPATRVSAFCPRRTPPDGTSMTTSPSPAARPAVAPASARARARPVGGACARPSAGSGAAALARAAAGSLAGGALALALAALPVARALAADPTAPPTPVHTVTDTYHGVAVSDPYRWMEDSKSPEWQAWVKAQAAHADAVLARIPGRDAMRKRLLELADAGEFMGSVEQGGGRLFYLKSEPGRSNRRLFMREGDAGAELLLLDPDALPGIGAPTRATTRSTSTRRRRTASWLRSASRPAGPKRACCASTTSRPVASCPSAIDRAGLNGDIHWRPDNRSFFYNRLPAPGADGKGELVQQERGVPARAGPRAGARPGRHRLGGEPGPSLRRARPAVRARPRRGRGGRWRWCCTATRGRSRCTWRRWPT